MERISIARPARKWAASAIAGAGVLAAMSGAEAGSAPARAASGSAASLPKVMADLLPVGDNLKTVFKVRPRTVNMDFYNPALPNEHEISLGELQKLHWSSYTPTKAVATGVLYLPYNDAGRGTRWRVSVTASHPRHGLFMQLYVTRFGAFHVHDKSRDDWACNRKRSYCHVAVNS